MIDFNSILERVKTFKNLTHNKHVAEMLGLSPADFSLRKKRGTLLPVLIEWAVNQNVNLDYLIRGKDTLVNEDLDYLEQNNPEAFEKAKAYLKGLKDGTVSAKQ
jgi:hypothetical protein